MRVRDRVDPKILVFRGHEVMILKTKKEMHTQAIDGAGRDETSSLSRVLPPSSPSHRVTPSTLMAN